MNEFQCPPMQVKSAKDIEAPLSIQFAQLWGRTLKFVKREPQVAYA